MVFNNETKSKITTELQLLLVNRFSFRMWLVLRSILLKVTTQNYPLLMSSGGEGTQVGQYCEQQLSKPLQ